jgi:hypothetical protein
MGEGCCGGDCGCDHEKSSNYMVQTMAQIADQAWGQVMMDKMKVEWEKQMGKTMDEVAKASVEHTKKIWDLRIGNGNMSAMPTKDMLQAFEEALNKAFKTK